MASDVCWFQFISSVVSLQALHSVFPSPLWLGDAHAILIPIAHVSAELDKVVLDSHFLAPPFEHFDVCLFDFGGLCHSSYCAWKESILIITVTRMFNVSLQLQWRCLYMLQTWFHLQSTFIAALNPPPGSTYFSFWHDYLLVWIHPWYRIPCKSTQSICWRSHSGFWISAELYRLQCSCGITERNCWIRPLFVLVHSIQIFISDCLVSQTVVFCSGPSPLV
jgi:hypothetical protein